MKRKIVVLMLLVVCWLIILPGIPRITAADQQKIQRYNRYHPREHHHYRYYYVPGPGHYYYYRPYYYPGPYYYYYQPAPVVIPVMGCASSYLIRDSREPRDPCDPCNP